MGNAQTRYKTKNGQNLLNTADIIINYHHFSIYFNDTMPSKLKSYIDPEIFKIICEHVHEVGSNSRKDLKQLGSNQCNVIGLLLVLLIIFVLIGIICIDYTDDVEWLGWIFITISLLFILCIVYLFKVNKPNEKLWWSQFLIAIRIKVDDMNKIFANKLHLSVVNFDEETDYDALAHRKKLQLDPNNTALYSCRIHFEQINTGASSNDNDGILKLDDLDELRNLPTGIDYAHLDEYQAKHSSFLTIDEEILSDNEEEEAEAQITLNAEHNSDNDNDNDSNTKVTVAERNQRRNSISLIQDDAGMDL